MQALVCAALALISAMTYGMVPSRQTGPDPREKQPFPGVLDEHPAIQYATRPTSDPVTRLKQAIAQGTASLTYQSPAGYLRSLLEVLEISPDSQLLVFSKTGLQRASTGPANPRALYFNDSVVVGYIPGARFLEIAAHDPEQGVVFYTIDQLATVAGQASSGSAATVRDGLSPDIRRGTNCLTCHVSGSTLDVPGMIARSNFTNANGGTIPQLGFHLVDHRTPLTERWGGWFVTGKYDAPPYGGVGHLGNVVTTLHPTRGVVAAMSNEVLHGWLNDDVVGRGYSSHESDIAALMVFDHQMRAINLLTRLNWEARVAGDGGAVVDFATGALRELVDEIADYFLFVDEVPPPARLTPRPGFAATFMAAGPKDSRGRSLRELDLESRLLRYPCSYMIHSAAFDHLPGPVRAAVYQRLAMILTAHDRDKYAHLSGDDRRAILEILRETKPDWPAWM